MNDDLRSPSNGRPMNVLVVDDDDGFRVVMQRRLTASRHQVECVPNGEAALERLAVRAFDVVLLDLRMPGLGGLETLKRIREADWPSEVVVLTGQPDYDDCVTAMKSGAFHYLCKPTEPALIEDALQRAVDQIFVVFIALWNKRLRIHFRMDTGPRLHLRNFVCRERAIRVPGDGEPHHAHVVNRCRRGERNGKIDRHRNHRVGRHQKLGDAPVE